MPTERSVVTRFWRLLTNAAASKTQSSPAGQQVRQMPGAAAHPHDLVLGPHSKDISFWGPCKTLVSFRKKKRIVSLPLGYASICSALCIHICIFLSLFLPLLLELQIILAINDELSRLVRSFHGGASNDVSVVNTGILSSAFVCTRKLSSADFSDAVRFEDTWFFRGSTTAMVVRVLKRALSYSEET